MYFPHGVTVYRLPFTAGSVDAHNNPVESWGAPVAIAGCAFDPGGSVEPFQAGRDAVVTQPTVFDPNMTAWSPYDRFTVDGNAAVYQVAGDPRTWRSPFSGWEPGIEVRAVRVDG